MITPEALCKSRGLFYCCTSLSRLNLNQCLLRGVSFLPDHKSKIALFHPASRSDPSKLSSSAGFLDERGFAVDLVDVPTPDESWPFTSGNLEQRIKTLKKLLLSDEYDVLWAARGGYGVSDLLPHMDWQQIRSTKPKTVVGFSDVSALLISCFQTLGWPCLHAPMPATTLWQEGEDDLNSLIALFKKPLSQWSLEVKLEPSAKDLKPSANGEELVAIDGEPRLHGKLFGGCFSVLTNLIGTPYFKPPLEPWILFFEDTDETAPRLMRYWNQWQQAGYTEGLQAIVVGNLRNISCSKQLFLDELRKRSGLPVLSTELFGHVQPNTALLLGAKASITKNSLQWTYHEGEANA